MQDPPREPSVQLYATRRGQRRQGDIQRGRRRYISAFFRDHKVSVGFLQGVESQTGSTAISKLSTRRIRLIHLRREGASYIDLARSLQRPQIHLFSSIHADFPVHRV